MISSAWVGYRILFDLTVVSKASFGAFGFRKISSGLSLNFSLNVLESVVCRKSLHFLRGFRNKIDV